MKKKEYYLNKEHIKEFFERFNDFSKKIKIRYFLIFGSLLGAIRENDILQWDYDVDIAISECDFIEVVKNLELLKNYNIFVEKIVYFENKPFDITLKYKNIPIDIYILHDQSDKLVYKYNDVIYHEKVKILEFDKKDIFPLKTTKFLGVEVTIPNNSKKVLEIIYGDWNVRDPIYWSKPWRKLVIRIFFPLLLVIYFIKYKFSIEKIKTNKLFILFKTKQFLSKISNKVRLIIKF